MLGRQDQGGVAGFGGIDAVGVLVVRPLTARPPYVAYNVEGLPHEFLGVVQHVLNPLIPGLGVDLGDVIYALPVGNQTQRLGILAVKHGAPMELLVLSHADGGLDGIDRKTEFGPPDDLIFQVDPFDFRFQLGGGIQSFQYAVCGGGEGDGQISLGQGKQKDTGLVVSGLVVPDQIPRAVQGVAAHQAQGFQHGAQDGHQILDGGALETRADHGNSTGGGGGIHLGCLKKLRGGKRLGFLGQALLIPEMGEQYAQLGAVHGTFGLALKGADVEHASVVEVDLLVQLVGGAGHAEFLPVQHQGPLVLLAEANRNALLLRDPPYIGMGREPQLGTLVGNHQLAQQAVGGVKARQILEGLGDAFTLGVPGIVSPSVPQGEQTHSQTGCHQKSDQGGQPTSLAQPQGQDGSLLAVAAGFLVFLFVLDGVSVHDNGSAGRGDVPSHPRRGNGFHNESVADAVHKLEDLQTGQEAHT